MIRAAGNFKRPMPLYRKLKMKEAEAAFRELIRKEPDNARAHQRLGAVLGAMGEEETAILETKQSIKLRPEVFFSHTSFLVSFTPIKAKWIRLWKSSKPQFHSSLQALEPHRISVLPTLKWASSTKQSPLTKGCSARRKRPKTTHQYGRVDGTAEQIPRRHQSRRGSSQAG